MQRITHDFFHVFFVALVVQRGFGEVAYYCEIKKKKKYGDRKKEIKKIMFSVST